MLLKIVGGNQDGQFRIDPVLGLLYVAKPLDAEFKSRYTLTVSAVDQANMGSRRQSSARVRIVVEDINDNDPTFEESEKTIYFDENEPAGSRVLRVSARAVCTSCSSLRRSVWKSLCRSGLFSLSYASIVRWNVRIQPSASACGQLQGGWLRSFSAMPRRVTGSRDARC